MKVALIGLGRISSVQIAAISLTTPLRLVDAFDIDESKSSLLPPGARFHRTLDEMLNESSADIYVISSPSQTHFEVATRILDFGRPVIVEKPLCLSVEELHSLADNARRNSLFLHVAFHAEYGAEIRWWLEHRDTKVSQLGYLTGFDSYFFDPYVTNGRLNERAESLVGSWYDSGINALSVVGKLVDPNTLRLSHSELTFVPQIPCAQIQGGASFSYSEETHSGWGRIETSWVVGSREKMTVLHYESGDVTFDHMSETCTISNKQGLVDRIECQTSHPRLVHHYVGVFRDLYDCLTRQTSNLEEAIVLHRLLFAAVTGSGKHHDSKSY